MKKRNLILVGLIISAIYHGCGIKHKASSVQGVNEYKVLLIDSISLEFYYVIKLSNNNPEEEYIHVLSFKDKGHCSVSQRIMVGEKYQLDLYELYTFVYDIQSGDSIYYSMSPNRGGIITTGGDVLYSSNIKPFYSEQLKGLCFKHK